jgi:hypothetical protein
MHAADVRHSTPSTQPALALLITIAPPQPQQQCCPRLVASSHGQLPGAHVLGATALWVGAHPALDPALLPNTSAGQPPTTHTAGTPVATAACSPVHSASTARPPTTTAATLTAAVEPLLLGGGEATALGVCEMTAVVGAGMRVGVGRGLGLGSVSTP